MNLNRTTPAHLSSLNRKWLRTHRQRPIRSTHTRHPFFISTPIPHPANPRTHPSRLLLCSSDKKNQPEVHAISRATQPGPAWRKLSPSQNPKKERAKLRVGSDVKFAFRLTVRGAHNAHTHIRTYKKYGWVRRREAFVRPLFRRRQPTARTPQHNWLSPTAQRVTHTPVAIGRQDERERESLR